MPTIQQRFFRRLTLNPSQKAEETIRRIFICDEHIICLINY